MSKIAAIHDISGIGKCSLTVVIPTLAAMGHYVCPLPTAVLSAHTGFKKFEFIDFTDHMPKFIENWKMHNTTFNCIYSGFLGSEKQIDIVYDFFNDFGGNALKIVDPVMGDNGKAYSTYTKSMCDQMIKLSHAADILTPNLTEAAILLEREYPETLDETQVKKWLSDLCETGAKVSVITGIERNGSVFNYAFDKKNNQYIISENNKIDAFFTGTGDLFASVMTGELLNGGSLQNSIDKAGKFVHDTVKLSVEQNAGVAEGLAFEKLLKTL